MDPQIFVSELHGRVFKNGAADRPGKVGGVQSSERLAHHVSMMMGRPSSVVPASSSRAMFG
jgi:hypothetical protein